MKKTAVHIIQILHSLYEVALLTHLLHSLELDIKIAYFTKADKKTWRNMAQSNEVRHDV